MPTATHNRIEIHYDDLGAGLPVVLLHSFLCSGRMWAGLLEPLAREFRVLNVDARGHGRSSHARDPFSFYETVRDVTAVLDAANVERCTWAGLSMGGMTALRAALTVPERVASLILLDTAAGTEPAWKRIKYRLLGGVARALGLRPLVPQVAREMFGPTTRRTRRELVRQWADTQLLGTDVPSALRTLDALLARDDLSTRLAEITVPATVIVGAEDRPQPPAVARALADGLPNATYVEIERTGHLSTVEQPDAVTDAMRAHLRRHA